MSNRQAVAFHEVLAGAAPAVRRAHLVHDAATGVYRFADARAAGTEVFAVLDPISSTYRLSTDPAGQRRFAYFAPLALVLL